MSTRLVLHLPRQPGRARLARTLLIESAMVVSALVLTLTSVPALRARALAVLVADPRLVVGEAIRDRLPVVAEAASAGEGAALCDALAEHEGVVRVDVVAIDFGEEA